MLGFVFCVLTMLGGAFAVVVIRAEPRRWDNRLIGAMAMLDALTAAYRGITLLEGRPLIAPENVPICAVLGLPLAWLSVEFAHSFPFGRPAPARLRVPVALATTIVLVLAVVPTTRAATLRLQPFLYAVPMFTVMVVLLARNLRAQTPGNKTAFILVCAAFILRWTSEIATYGVAQSFFPSAAPMLTLFDATVAVLVCDLLITIAVLRSQLFSVRGLATTVLASIGSAIAALTLAACTIEAALHFARDPRSLRASLLLATLMPVAALAAGLRLRGRIELAIAHNIDPRRALRERVLERAEASRDADPTSMLRTIRDALTEITAGARVQYLRAGGAAPSDGDLPTELAERLGESPSVLRVHMPELPYDLVVAVRSHTTLHGVFAVVGGRIDRDTLMAAKTLADRLALKLDAYSLVVELEAARRLATLGSFAAAIAHDIRTPLTSVKMNVQILRSKAKSSSIKPEEDLESFDIALEELDRLNAGITELLDFAKPARVESAFVDVRALVLDVARAIEPALAPKKLILDVKHDDDRTLPRAFVDAQRLRQVFENLATNAADASKEGGRVEIYTRRADDGRIAIEISDEGHGIAAKNLPHIFEPFFTTRPDGTGLGLAICDKLVRAHGGEIRVETGSFDDGAHGTTRGTRFTVLLPAESAEGVPPMHDSLREPVRA